MKADPGGNPALYPLPYIADPGHYFTRIRHLRLPALLASGDSGHPAARYDILAADPRVILRTRDGNNHIEWPREARSTTVAGSPFSVLADQCPPGPANNTGLPFTGGAIGWFGYELLHASNGITTNSKPALGLSDMQVAIYDWAVISDHRQQESYLVCRDAACARADDLLAQLLGPAPDTSPARFRLDSPFTSNFSHEQYLSRFQRIIDYIHAGDCYQVNLAQCFTAHCSGDPWQAFQQLQQHANAPFAAYLEQEQGNQAVLSFSPERFLRVREREVLTQPIKGTRPRSNDPAQDLAKRLELETSTKDRAENLMIVDLLRNDLGHVCATGSVSTENLFETQSFTNVHHLVSTIKGRLNQAADVFALLEAA